MNPIARGNHGELHEAAAERIQSRATKKVGAPEYIPESICTDADPVGFDQRNEPLHVALDTEDRAYPEQAFSPHDCHGHLMTGCHFAHDGDDTGIRKIDRSDFISRSRQRTASRYASALSFSEQRVAVALG